MKQPWFWVWGLMLALLAGPALADERNDKIARLLNLAGAEGQITGLTDSVIAGLEQAQQSAQDVDAERGEVMLHVAKESFLPEVIYQQVFEAVSAAVQDDQLETLLLWYQSPLGKRITEMEVQASSPASRQAMMQNATALLSNEPMMEKAAQFDALLHLTDYNMALQKRMLIAAQTQVRKLHNPDQPVDTSDVEAFFEQRRALLTEQTRKTVMLSFAHTYRELEADKLESYLDFLSTPSARQFNEAIKVGLGEGLDLVFEDYIAGLAEE